MNLLTFVYGQMIYITSVFIHMGFVLFVWYSVFHVTDQLGNKVTDERLIDYIREVCYSKLSQYCHFAFFLLVRVTTNTKI